jgi:hypothetical protein
MATYKYLTETTLAKIDADGKSRMSCTTENSEYLAWLAEGGLPEPADIVIPSYAELRAAEYPPITELIDGLVKDDTAQIAAYKAACLAVKAKYPKA